MIAISFAQTATNQLLLTIKDNGPGLPPHFNLKETASMGMNLMRGLSQEIDAAFTIDTNQGTQIAVSFMYEPDLIPGLHTNH